jgi:hypothetical protein
VLLNVEALEDNEVLTVERIRHISRIVDPKNRACLEKLEVPQEVLLKILIKIFSINYVNVDDNLLCRC